MGTYSVNFETRARSARRDPWMRFRGNYHPTKDGTGTVYNRHRYTDNNGQRCQQQSMLQQKVQFKFSGTHNHKQTEESARYVTGHFSVCWQEVIFIVSRFRHDDA